MPQGLLKSRLSGKVTTVSFLLPDCCLAICIMPGTGRSIPTRSRDPTNYVPLQNGGYEAVLPEN